MTEFFDQICEVLAKTGKKYPGQLEKCENMKQFFSELPRPAAVPVQAPAQAPAQAPVQTPAPRSGAMTNIAAAENLTELAKLIENCQNCPLGAKRNHLVFGAGNPDARLMFIGEAPGYEEDSQGVPFVGKAGQLLDKMINAMQFTREEVYIANIIKCRPDGNRNPMPDEISKCIGVLHRQIELIRPEVIVCLGAIAAKALLQTESGISKLRGKWCSYENIPVMPTFHPAYLLREEQAKRDAWKDLQLVMARFGKFHRR